MSAQQPASDIWQPDLFGGAGIQRTEGLTHADELERARQEMRDTGSADLFDAIADTPAMPRRAEIRVLLGGLIC